MLLLLLACTGESWMRAAPDAGFELGPVQSALWFDYGDGIGAVLLSTEALDCTVFDGGQLGEDEVVVGVAFTRARERWEGAYYLGLVAAGGDAWEADSPYMNRFLAGAWVRGESYSAYGYGEATLEGVGERAIGEAHTELLDARFAAEVCTTSHPDCDDSAAEVCNGVDDDCDGEIDEGVGTQVYVDHDGDGWGEGDGGYRCGVPDGYATDTGDCDDGDGTVYPGAEELCDGRDHDCDGTIDDECG